MEGDADNMKDGEAAESGLRWGGGQSERWQGVTTGGIAPQSGVRNKLLPPGQTAQLHRLLLFTGSNMMN